MVPTGNLQLEITLQTLSSVSYSTKVIHQHHNYYHLQIYAIEVLINAL